MSSAEKRAVVNTASADVALAFNEGAGQVLSAHDEGRLICYLRGAASRVLAMPFDTLRAQCAMAVQWGLVRRSLLVSRADEMSRCRDVESLLDNFEKLTPGPLARRV